MQFFSSRRVNCRFNLWKVQRFTEKSYFNFSGLYCTRSHFVADTSFTFAVRKEIFFLEVTMIKCIFLSFSALTLIAVFMVNFGFGIKAPCIGSLGGDQFLLPQQDKQLSLFFVLLYTVSSIASVMASFFSPILRKDIRCFGELNCYSLVFVIPAGIVFIGLGKLLTTLFIQILSI